MIKTLLLLILLTAPVAAKDHDLTQQQCKELAEILEESGKGRIYK